MYAERANGLWTCSSALFMVSPVLPQIPGVGGGVVAAVATVSIYQGLISGWNNLT